jgi:hypothetical protein
VSKSEIYVSVDVESDGPIPGPNSMLSLGAAAFTEEGKLATTFEVNFETLPGAVGHPDTMAWWKTQPDAWAYCRANPQDPEKATKALYAWIEKLPGKPVFTAYPAGYDFLFGYWYLMRFVGKSPFSHSALDIKTFAMATMGGGYRDATKKNMPKRWFSNRPHTHKALDDAIEQGELFINILNENKKLRAAR